MKNISIGLLNISINKETVTVNDKYFISIALLKKIWLIQFILKQIAKIIFVMFIFK